MSSEGVTLISRAALVIRQTDSPRGKLTSYP
jgi:hypothetical protein